MPRKMKFGSSKVALFLVMLACAPVATGLFAVAQETAPNTSASGTSAPATSASSVPRLVRFSGVAKNTNNASLTGAIGITFLLYKDQEGGAPLWMETQNVQPDSSGHYTVQLGSTLPYGLPADLFTTSEAHWLGVQISGQAEQPRVLPLSVPYALKALDAETIGGLPPSAFVKAAPDAPSMNGSLSGSLPANPIAATLPGTPTPGSNPIRPPATTPGYVPKFKNTSGALKNSTIFDNSASPTSGCCVGIGTTTPTAALEVNGSGLFDSLVGIGSANTGSFFQLSVLANTNPGAIYGQTNASGGFFGVGGLSFNTASIGVIGQNMGGGGVPGFDTFNIGVAGQSNNGIGVDGSVESGTGVRGRTYTLTGGYGVYGESFGETSGSTGVYGTAYNVSATAATYGVYGVTSSSAKGSTGVYGYAPGSSTSLFTYGVYGVSNDNAFGASVAGTGAAISSLGSDYGGGAAVWGDLANSNCCYSVLGTADDNVAVLAINNTGTDTESPALEADNNSTTTSALLFLADAPFSGGNSSASCTIDVGGDLSCTGTIKQNVPAAQGRQLELYGVASPENWFEDFGSGQLSGGSVKIALDPAFASTVNSENYHVFVTPNGDCKGLYVASKTARGFEIRELGNGSSDVSFDYRIVAKRRGYENVRLKDVTDQMNGIRNHQAKRLARRMHGAFPSAPPPAVPLAASPKSQLARLGSEGASKR